jgi:hypothetical protein
MFYNIDLQLYDSAIDEILSDLKTTSMSSLHLPFTSAYVGQKRGSLSKPEHSRQNPSEPQRTKKVQFPVEAFQTRKSERRAGEQRRQKFGYYTFLFLGAVKLQNVIHKKTIVTMSKIVSFFGCCKTAKHISFKNIIVTMSERGSFSGCCKSVKTYFIQKHNCYNE